MTGRRWDGMGGVVAGRIGDGVAQEEAGWKRLLQGEEVGQNREWYCGERVGMG